MTWKTYFWLTVAACMAVILIVRGSKALMAGEHEKAAMTLPWLALTAFYAVRLIEEAA